ncbi:helix-turn-helix domain-containing protein [Enterococcus faecium]|uniref:helix-turn-helix domain-containing protein n=1 Tax=Enterococcus faecium TaxID=1352 RepID=UPI00115D91BC|nr:helix-turn-helix transcriptional regulator [Enterococcus faecium]
MAISYKPLWHLLIEKEMNKKDLKEAANITNNVIARMGKDLYVNLETIEKICLALNCNVEDVISINRVEKDGV